MRFAVINTVPPGFCRKMHLLAPGGDLADLAQLRRDALPQVGLSPTHMEAIQGFNEWHQRGISPSLGLLMWYLESIQLPSGAFLRTEDAPSPSVGVAIRFLQLAGQIGVDRSECESVERAAVWLESQIEDDGLIRMPITGLTDYGMMARAIRSLCSVSGSVSDTPAVDRACETLAKVQLDQPAWPTYPNANPSTGATALALTAIASFPQRFDAVPDPTWLLDAQNADGGWGEYAGSPSRIDNTFWAYRACTAAGHDLSTEVDPSLLTGSGSDGYNTAMAQRLRTVMDESDEPVTDLALKSLRDDADRYAETALYGLAISESKAVTLVEADPLPTAWRLPVQTPDFIRREPPLYDQLADISKRTWWIRLVELAARARVAEASIGWLVGLSAAIALIGEEFVNGLASLSLAPLIIIATIEVLITLGWLAARQSRHRRLNGVPHFGLAVTLAFLLVLLIESPPSVSVPLLPSAMLTGLLALIIEVVSVATDKADLLNRLGED